MDVPQLKSVQHLFVYAISFATPKSCPCFDSRSLCETSLMPSAGSRTSVNAVAQSPQSQKCAASFSGFSSNGADDPSFGVTEIEVISNRNNLPSVNECS